MQIKFSHRPEIVSFSAFQELFCPRSLSPSSVLSLLTPTEFRLDVRCFPSDLRPPTSPSTTITSTSMNMSMSMSMNGPGNLCFVIHSSFVIRASSVFFASHFPLLVSLTSPAGTRRPEPAPNPSSALPSPPFRLQPLRFVRAREANIAREISPKTQPHLPWSSAIP